MPKYMVAPIPPKSLTGDVSGFSQSDPLVWFNTVVNMMKNGQGSRDLTTEQGRQAMYIITEDNKLSSAADLDMKNPDTLTSLAKASMEGRLFVKPTGTEAMCQILTKHEEGTYTDITLSSPCTAIPLHQPEPPPAAPSAWIRFLSIFFSFAQKRVADHQAATDRYQHQLDLNEAFSDQDLKKAFRRARSFEPNRPAMETFLDNNPQVKAEYTRLTSSKKMDTALNFEAPHPITNSKDPTLLGIKLINTAYNQGQRDKAALMSAFMNNLIRTPDEIALSLSSILLAQHLGDIVAAYKSDPQSKTEYNPFYRAVADKKMNFKEAVRNLADNSPTINRMSTMKPEELLLLLSTPSALREKCTQALSECNPLSRVTSPKQTLQHQADHTTATNNISHESTGFFYK